MSDARQNVNVPIAILGMACRLPGAANLDEYWRMLVSGSSPIAEMPPERFNERLYFDPRKGVRGKSYSKLAGLLADRQFHRAACPLPPSLESSADNAHLLMCEVAAAACRHAGLDPFALPHRNAGVYIGHAQGSDLSGELTLGACIDEAAQFLREVPGFDQLPESQQQAIVDELIAAVRSRVPQRQADSPDPSIGMVAGVISKAFGLDGPYLAINSACASSLQAIQLAARALQSGRIDLAIAGGASDCKEGSVVLFSHAQSMSPAGSRPFDEQADGLVIAEGYVAVVLKTLPRALADGDRIQALITGIGCSSDGKGKSLWAPRKEGQVKAMERAYRHGLDMSTLQYVEAHATSTSLGDATELSTLAEVLGGKIPAGRKIPVTSVKANIGHALEAAGIAGLIKTVLCMQRRTIVAAINIESLNSKIDWDRAPICIPRENLPWPEPQPGQPRRAAVNAFGIGGLNMHVVVEELTDAHRAAWAPGSALAQVAGEPRRREPALDDEQAVAVIGRGCIFPGASNIERYWDLIRSNRDPKGPTPPDRWRSDLALEPRTASTRRLPTTCGGYIADFAYDWQKHKVPPKQVQQADPLQFMLLEGAEQALHDAGYDRRPFDRERVAVFVGTESGGDFGTQLCVSLRLPEIEAMISERLIARGMTAEQAAPISQQYSETLLRHWPALVDESGSFSTSTLASRITKTMNLMGGAAAIDAGDASAAAALASSVDLLLAGDCDLAICAGGQRCMNFPKFEGLHLAGALAEDAQSPSPFDEAARGILPGEGVGVVLLKRLSDARRDGDRIHAIVRGIGAAHDESPRAALVKAMQRAAAAAGVNLADVAVVEAAGSGSPSADAEHAAALVAVYGSAPRRQPLLLSTVTGQIGHTIGASAMASLLKASLEIEHGEVPSTWGLRQPLAALAEHPETVRPVVAAEPIRLADAQGRRFAAVDSLGKGLAYHIILERGQPVVINAPAPQAVVEASKAAAPTGAMIYRFAASSPEQLGASIERTMAQPASAAAGEFCAGDRVRLAVVANSPAELVEKLRSAAAQWSNPAARPVLERQGCFYRVVPENRPRVAFLFPGQGSQYAGMLRELTSDIPAAAVVRQQFDEIMSRLGQRTFTSIAWEQPEQLGVDIWVTQSSVLMADLIMNAALQARGILPDVAAGHSQGEYAALAATGAMDLSATVRAARARYEAIEATPSARGALLATTAPPAAIEPLIAALAERAYLANFNAPDQTVVGGKPATLEILATLLKAQGFQAQLLTVPCPYHTPLMSGVGAVLQPALEAIAVRPPRVPFVSTVTNRYVAEPADIRANLVAQLTTPVRYLDLIRRLADDEPTVFVEVGPSRALTNLNQRILADRGPVDLIASDNPKRPGAEQLLHVQALLECLGAYAAASPSSAGIIAPSRSRQLGSVVHVDATETRREKMRRQAAGAQTPVAAIDPAPLSDAGGRNGLAASPPLAEAPAPPTVLAAAPPSPPPPAADSADLEKFLINFVVEQTGYPPEVVDLDADLEADLGIDSIKKAQLFGELSEYFDVRPAEGMTLDDFPTLRHALNFLSGQSAPAPRTEPTPRTATAPASIKPVDAPSHSPAAAVSTAAATAPATSAGRESKPQSAANGALAAAASSTAATLAGADSASAGAPAADSADLEKFLINFVVEQTGYPPEVVDLDADLEADLGIDSIKKAQLFGELSEYFDVRPAEGMTLDDFPTLRHALDFLSGADSKKKVRITPAELAATTALTAPAEEPPLAPRSPSATAEPSNAPLADPALRADSFPLAEFAGTAYQIGRAHGEQYRASILRLLRRFADLADGDLSEPTPFALDQLPDHFEFDEIEELRGIADAVQVSLHNLLAVNIAVDADRAAGARQCAVPVGRGSTLAHAAEFLPPLPAALGECMTPIVSLRRPAQGYAQVVIGYAGIVGALAGVNQRGLAISAAPLAPAGRDGRVRHGRGHARLVQSVLSAAANVDEAAALLGRLVSPDGWRACVSHGPSGVAKQLVCDGPGREIHSEGASSDSEFALAFQTGPAVSDAIANIPAADRLLVVVDSRDSSCYLRAPDLPASVSRLDLAPRWPQTANQPADARTVALDATTADVPLGPDSSTARFVLRMKAAPLPDDAPQTPRLHGAVLVVGQNAAAAALCQRLHALGATIYQLAETEDVAAAVAQLETWWRATPISHLFVMTERGAGSLNVLDGALWQRRRRAAVELPFFLAQRWIQLAGEAQLLPKCSYIGATALGGRFGFSGRIGSPASAALAGLAKALYIEIAYMRNHRSMIAKAIDFSDEEAPDRIAESVLREWASGSADFEVAYLAGQRHLPYAFPEPAQPSAVSAIRPGGVWVFTGGARGITAECALALGRRYGLRLHLIGSSPPPQVKPEWRNLSDEALRNLKTQVMRDARASGRNMDEAWGDVEKSLEIERRLRAFAEAGVSAEYHACDVADESALAAVLATIRRTSGPIEGIVHGAGIERPSRFERKTRENVLRTIAIKVDGALHLMRLTWQDPVRHFIGFGSISGRLGSNGQADYCIASDLLCKAARWYRQARPGVHATGFHWHSWAEIGMAAKAETAKVLQMSNGPAAMPKQEGVAHFLRELASDQDESEVLITTWEYHGRYYGTADHPPSVAADHPPSVAAESPAAAPATATATPSTAPPTPAAAPVWAPFPLAPIAARHRLTVVPAPLPIDQPATPRFAGPLWILGDNRFARALQERLATLGATVERLPMVDSASQMAAFIDERFASARPSGIFLLTGRDDDPPELLDARGWRQRRTHGVVMPFLALQYLFRLRRQAADRSLITVTAVTSLGGDFGFSGDVAVPEGGALCGLLKSLYIEDSRLDRRELRVKVIDAPAGEPPAQLVAAVLRELAAADATIETAWSHGVRSVVRATAEPIESLPRRPVPRGGNWVVTGGARGITAAAAMELARRHGLKLHLIGRSPAPRADAPWRSASAEQLARIKAQVVREALAAGEPVERRWEPIRADLEIFDTLERYADAGVEANYYSCDLADWDRLAEILAQIRRTAGPIEGVIHGAGYGKSGRFDARPADSVQRVLAGKLDGAVALMALTQNDPIKYWVGFGSISGRFGGNGLADYAAANDMLAKLVDRFRAQRPDGAACCFHWQSWDEVGMAMLGDSVTGAKNTLGMKFLSPREGVEHFCREIEAGLPSTEVLITDGFFERTFYPSARSPIEQAAPRASLPLVAQLERTPDGAASVGQIVLDPSTDPFLYEHRLRDKPLLPAVVGLEALAEAAALASRQSVAVLRDIQFLRGVRFAKAEPATVRVRVASDGHARYDCQLLSDFRSRSGKVLERDRLHFRAVVETAGDAAAGAGAAPSRTERPLEATIPPPPGPWRPFHYPDDGLMFHGPAFRGLVGLWFAGQEGWGQLTALPPTALGGRLRRGEWLMPAVLLDAAFYACGVYLWSCVEQATALPAAIGALWLGAAPRDGESCLVHIRFRGVEGASATFDFTIADGQGAAVARVAGYRCEMLRAQSLAEKS